MKSTCSVLALLFLTTLSTGCTAQGNKVDFDQMATQAIQKIRALPEILPAPCFPTIAERDYRYQYCFQDKSGSTAETVKHMRKAMEDAGFRSLSQGSQNGELDTTYRVTNSPYSVEITFTGTDFNWVMWEDKRGYVAPRPVVDDGSRYALLDPTEMARQMLLELILSAGAGYTLNNSQAVMTECGKKTVNQGSACTNINLTIEKSKAAIMKRFFANQKQWFKPLDSKSTFEYREEQLLADMLVEGSRTKDSPPSSLLVKKESAGIYFMTDQYSWPAYEFRFYLPTKADGPLKVTGI